jgi:adenine-specific DNA-methyltransferase
LLGIAHETAYYFYYEKDRATGLDFTFLQSIQTRAANYVIYADSCALDSEWMQAKNIRFKKIPRDIQGL